MVFRTKTKYFEPDKRPVLMGILNITPDSFSDGGKYFETDIAIEHCKNMIDQGADIIDIGGESSRPGAIPVTEEEELRRIIPVIEVLKSSFDVCISVDTYKPMVANETLCRGADMINNIFGTDPNDDLLDIVKKYSAGLCLMHIKGTPQNMQKHTHYNDIMKEIKQKLREAAEHAVKKGINIENIAIDPGIGFGKSKRGNFEILNRLEELHDQGFNIMIGASRKSFIAKALGKDDKSRLMGTISSNVAAPKIDL
ncbi:MAG: dihydropteroate synthase [Candidatus Delongbacteria bacterium]